MRTPETQIYSFFLDHCQGIPYLLNLTGVVPSDNNFSCSYTTQTLTILKPKDIQYSLYNITFEFHPAIYAGGIPGENSNLTINNKIVCGQYYKYNNVTYECQSCASVGGVIYQGVCKIKDPWPEGHESAARQGVVYTQVAVSMVGKLAGASSALMLFMVMN
jgi:hypothetical protein